MKLKWQQAPVKTQWGDEMVVASVAIDKDHTVDLYCERGQTPKVEAMFALAEQPAPVQQELVEFEVEGELLTAQQLAALELFKFQEATGCDTADQFVAKSAPQPAQRKPLTGILSIARHHPDGSVVTVSFKTANQAQAFEQYAIEAAIKENT